MGALGHFLERQGIPTASISLVREHTETIRPPRALWVTFELGRPLGIPDDADFQRRVLRATAGLLERTDGPLIVDYPEEVAEEADFTGWACPINLAPQATDTLAAEIDRLATWHDQSIARTGRTTVGVSGLDIPAAGLSMRSVERELVLTALRKAGFVQKDAAALLGVSRRKLNYMVQRMGITHPSWRRNRGEPGGGFPDAASGRSGDDAPADVEDDPSIG